MLREMTRVAALAAAATAGAAAGAAAPEPPRLASLDGSPSLDVRLRAEHADSESVTHARDSTAATLRARLGYVTRSWEGFDGAVEYEGVIALDKAGYNSTTAGSAQATRAGIADPTGSEVNQAWLRYSGVARTSVQVGRVRLAFDNQRWVGNVAWRQNEQTYDGGIVVTRPVPGMELSYAYLVNINSILFTNIAVRGNLVNAAYRPVPWLKATAYGYWLDFFAPGAGNKQDSQTRGLRLAGTPAVSQTIKLLYTVEYARQSEFEEAFAAAHADYRLGELGGSIGATQLKFGYEVLGSNAGRYALQTPLATLHAHDGWADLYLVTPVTGLRDAYGSASTTLAGVELSAVVHRFSADVGGVHYGDEIDVAASYGFSRYLAGTVKVAHYDASAAPAKSFAGNVDTAKGWLQLEYKF